LQATRTPTEAEVQQPHVGLAGFVAMSHAVDEEDTEMPDITREKFPDVEPITGVLFVMTVKFFNGFTVIFCHS